MRKITDKAIKILSSETSSEAIAELEYYAGFNREKVIEQIQVAMDMGAEAIKEQQWILCRDEQPKESGRYIVTTRYGEVDAIAYSKKNQKWNSYDSDNGENAIKSVIAWKPFPEPYKEVTNG